jgi:hypothetical protein
MKNLIQTIQLTEMNRSLAIELGQRLIRSGIYLSSLKTVVPIMLMIVSGVVSVAAQTPSGTFFDGNSAQLGNSLRSVTFFLAAGMIIAGIIFIAVGSQRGSGSMFGALIVVFYLSLRMPSFDEHYRYIIGFECRVALRQRGHAAG